MPERISRERAMLGIDDLIRRIFGVYLKAGARPPMDLTVGQMDCMRAIGRMGSPSMSELSRALHLRPSTVTGLVDALVERGTVERLQDPQDRRIVRVQLTPEGRRERDRLRRKRQKRVLELLAHLSDEELAAVHSALGTLDAAAQRLSAADHSHKSGGTRT